MKAIPLSREYGAGAGELPRRLAEAVGWERLGRELLEQEAVRLGNAETDLGKIAERAVGIFQRFHPASICRRHIAGVGQIMHELAKRGGAIDVGRAGRCFLCDCRRALAIRLVVPMAARLRRVMEYRGSREGMARKLIAEGDGQRRGFCKTYFGVGWASPLEDHFTVNRGTRGPAAVDLGAIAATRHGNRTE